MCVGTSTGRCSTTSSGWKGCGPASGSTKWITRRSAVAAVPRRISSLRSAGTSSGKRVRDLPAPLEGDVLGHAAGLRERERFLVAPAHLGRRVGVGGEGDRHAGGDEAPQEAPFRIRLADRLAETGG